LLLCEQQQQQQQQRTRNGEGTIRLHTSTPTPHTTQETTRPQWAAQRAQMLHQHLPSSSCCQCSCIQPLTQTQLVHHSPHRCGRLDLHVAWLDMPASPGQAFVPPRPNRWHALFGQAARRHIQFVNRACCCVSGLTLLMEQVTTDFAAPSCGGPWWCVAL
jgi:hypothetical protein